MDIRGFSEKGAWYKGNLHSHTTNSDGMLTPKESAELFKSRGYAFLCITDHDRYSDYSGELGDENFLILPGYEASAVLYSGITLRRRIKVHHVNAILGTSEMQRRAVCVRPEHLEFLPQRVFFGSWNGAAVLQEMVGRMERCGFIAMYNHPVWSRVSEYEFTGTRGLFAMEIFNYNTVNESGTGFDTLHWDLMLREGRRILGAATDDNHNEGKFDDACGGWITVKSERLTHDEIITNILAGNYYSSSGPEIYDWGVKNGRAFVSCGAVSRVNFIAGGCVNDGASVLCGAPDETMEYAEYKLSGSESYLRAECIDRYGRTAWTNPIFLREQ